MNRTEAIARARLIWGARVEVYAIRGLDSWRFWAAVPYGPVLARGVCKTCDWSVLFEGNAGGGV